MFFSTSCCSRRTICCSLAGSFLFWHSLTYISSVFTCRVLLSTLMLWSSLHFCTRFYHLLKKLMTKSGWSKTRWQPPYKIHTLFFTRATSSTSTSPLSIAMWLHRSPGGRQQVVNTVLPNWMKTARRGEKIKMGTQASSSQSRWIGDLLHVKPKKRVSRKLFCFWQK